MNLDHMKNEISKLNLEPNTKLSPSGDCIVILGCAMHCYLGINCAVGCQSGCSTNCTESECVNGCNTGCTTGECSSGCSSGCYSMMSQ